MRQIQSTVISYGILYTTFGEFVLLSPEPERYNLPWYLRDGAFSFFVRDGYGIARHLIVKGDFGISLYDVIRDVVVTFDLEDEVLKVSESEV